MKQTLRLISLLVLMITLSFVPNKEKEKFVVVLDAGHGGNDEGAKKDELVEKHFTLEIAKQIIASNTNQNIEFILMREADEFIELQKRVDKINEIKPDLVLSLHLNRDTSGDLNGYEIFVSPENTQYEKSKEWAEKLIAQFESSPLSNRGVKEQRFKIIRESNSPAMLFELGFISNSNDIAYLKSEEGKKEIVHNMLRFLNELNP